MTNQEHKDLERLMEDFCKRAKSYGCDSVQVLASVVDKDNGDTISKRRGIGNWYARSGMAQEFVSEESARTEENIKRSEFSSEDDDEGRKGEDG